MATGTVDSPFTLDLTTVDPTVTETEPTPLPPGISWDGPTRTLSGTPTAPGSWEVRYSLPSYGSGTVTIDIDAGDAEFPVDDDGELELGVRVTVPVWELAGSPEVVLVGINGAPPGLVSSGDHRELVGAPTEEGTFLAQPMKAGSYGGDEPHGEPVELVVVPAGSSGGGDGGDGPGRAAATLVVGELAELDLPAVLGVDEPVVPVVEPVPAGMTHTGAGVLVGRPTEEGELELELRDDTALVGTVDVLILPAGSQATDDPWAVWDDLAASLAPRVAAMVGQHGSEPVIDTAKAQLPLVAEYVRGYTRGRGFDGSSPAGPLLAVIVSATARLATNPEQLTAYTMGDYSERPARLAGWTLAEIGVLHRFRVVAA